MKRSSLVFPAYWILLLISCASAQISTSPANPFIQLKPGVVIETVAKNSEAERAGVQVGDILLNWVRADARGQLNSPFDLAEIEIEQAPHGNVTVEGLRGTELQSWTIGPDSWGMQARPNFQGKLRDIYLEGQELLMQGKLNEAAARWQAGAAEAQKFQIEPTGPWLLFHAAEMLTSERQYKEADDAYQKAALIAKAADLPFVAQLFHAWANSFQKRNDWDNAEKYYQQAIAEGRKSGKDPIVALNLNDIGNVALGRGDLAKAEQYYREALDIRDSSALGSLPAAASLNNLGRVAWTRGDLAKAEEYFGQALDIRSKLAPGSLAVAASLNNIGLVAQDRGDLIRAEGYHIRSLEIKQKLAPGSLDVAASFNNLGNVAVSRGDLEKAKKYYSQALGLREQIVPGSHDVATTFTNLGVVAQMHGDLAKAEDYLHQALAIQQKLAPKSIVVAVDLNVLGVVARTRGDLTRADWYYGQALAIRQKLAPGSLDVAESFSNLCVLASDRGDVVKAAWYQRQALRIRQKLAPGSLEVANSLNNLGELAKQQGNLDKAEVYYSQSLKITEKLSPEGLLNARNLQSLGELAQERHNPTRAEQYFYQALAILEKLAPESADYAESLAALALLVRGQHQLDATAQFFEKALAVLETQTVHLGGSQDIRSEFRAKYSDYYKDYIDLLMRQKRPEQAFHVAERWRAQSLLETLAAARVGIHHGADPELVQRERSLQASMNAKRDHRVLLLTGQHTEEQVKAVEKEIDGLRTEYDEVESRIRTTSPAYAALTQPESLTVNETQRLLDGDTLLLEYSLGKEHSYLWAVTSTTFTAHELPGRSLIEATARRLYQLVSSRNSAGEEANQAKDQRYNHLNTTAAAVSRMLLNPVAKQLSAKHLVIVADGALQYTPFSLLPQPGKSGGIPLILAHEITYLPSASVVVELRQEAARRRQAPKAVAVLADPVFDRTDSRVAASQRTPTSHKVAPQPRSVMRSAADVGLAHLPRLPFTRREADAIMAVTPDGQVFEAIGFEANRELATSPDLAQYRIVHFATHALSDNRHPELSGLVLSLVNKNGMPQNGFLDLQDIYNLNLPADLVVLSGCETALGKEIQGEGIIGLTRGFMYAGANRVVASLWNVDDASTKMLMERFYRAMEQQNMSPATALRTAQIGLWKQSTWKDPFYWAGFQIQGEWK